MAGRADSCDGNLDEMTAMARKKSAKAIQIFDNVSWQRCCGRKVGTSQTFTVLWMLYDCW